MSKNPLPIPKQEQIGFGGSGLNLGSADRGDRHRIAMKGSLEVQGPSAARNGRWLTATPASPHGCVRPPAASSPQAPDTGNPWPGVGTSAAQRRLSCLGGKRRRFGL
jgi:hypothetical protein